MKKYFKLHLLLLLLMVPGLLLVGCSDTDTDTNQESSDATVVTTENSNGGIVDEDRPTHSDRDFPLIYLTDAAREIALEDFDYLANVLLDNAPTQLVMPRLFGGLTFEDILDFYRGLIETMEPMESLHFIVMGEDDFIEEMPTDDLELAGKYLATLLFWMSFELDFIGHMAPQTRTGMFEMLEIHSALFHQMEIVDGRVIMDDEDMGSEHQLPRLQRRLDSFSHPSALAFYGIDINEIDLERSTDDFGFFEEGNVTTEILEAGRVGYIQIDSFMNNRAFDAEVLFPFYEEVQDFDHLIIDVRGNGGGTVAYLRYIVSMLIDEPITAYNHEFFLPGDLAYIVFEDFGDIDEWDEEDEEEFVGFVTVEEFLAEHDFPELNADDLAHLAYVITWGRRFEPREDGIPFGGDIWLLVDEGSASLSELLAMIAIDTGFATVVGEPTAGVTPTQHAFFVLPRTGILYRVDLGYVIDAYGRSLEEHGVTPHITIPPGADALDYVLGLINGVPQTANVPVVREDVSQLYGEWTYLGQPWLRFYADGIGLNLYTGEVFFWYDDGRIDAFNIAGMDFLIYTGWELYNGQLRMHASDGSSWTYFHVNGTDGLAVDPIFSESDDLIGTWYFGEDAWFTFHADGTAENLQDGEQFTWQESGRLNALVYTDWEIRNGRLIVFYSHGFPFFYTVTPE